jgi:hypothetical protein
MRTRGRSDWRFKKLLRTRGQAMVEWLIAVSLLCLAVVSVQGGPLEQTVSAIGAHYQRYTHAMARP